MSLISRRLILGPKLSFHNILLRKSRSNFRKIIHKWFSSSSESSADQGPYFIAADASPYRCRAALVTENGKIIKVASETTKVFQNGIFFEMSTNNIWEASINCFKKLTQNTEVQNVKGIGYVATPGLVCLDGKGEPVTASVSRDPNINCILYYDQRSLLETEKINQTRHSLLQYFGDRVYTDLQESKMLWLKHNLKEDCWDKVGHFIDLSDFLTWKATGSFVRSSSVLISNWSYEITVNGNEGWNAGFFNEIEMSEIAEDKFNKLGTNIQRPGIPVPNGLLENVAKEMGLPAGLPVATSMSDTLAGGLGIIGCQTNEIDQDVTTRLSVVFTPRVSSYFTVSHNPVFIKGIWGPFKDSMLPGKWVNYAGQTAAESVIDYIIDRHPSITEVKKYLGNMHIHKYLNKILKLKTQKYDLRSRSFLTKDFHILPDFDGNKSPLADPRIRGMISGLSLVTNQESLAIAYLAAMQSLAYSTRHIISTMTHHGQTVKSIIVGGDLGKNSIFVTVHKNICGVPIISPDETRCKLIGAAILAALASKHFQDFNEAIQSMCGKAQVVLPDEDKATIEFHNKKFQVFLKMYEHQLEYRRIMSSENDVEKSKK